MNELLLDCKVIVVPLDSNGLGTVNISVPFQVKHIKVVNVGYQSINAVQVGNYLISSLVEGNILTMLYRDDSLAPISYNQNSNYIFRSPVNISSQYTFQLYNFDGTLASNTGNEFICLQLEFYNRITTV